MARKPNDCRWLDHYMDVCRNSKTHPAIWRTADGTLIFAEPTCQRCDGCGYEPITPDAPAWDDPAESEERWADEYFVKWEATSVEARRLRDLVRRLADSLGVAVDALKASAFFPSPPPDRRHVHLNGVDITALLDEAREATGEDKP